MANADAAFGLRPVGSRGSMGSYTGKVTPYYVNSSYGTALFIGDPVVHVGDSNDAEFKGFPAGSLMEVEKATAGDGNAVTGVIVGFSPLESDLTKRHNPASTERIAYVADDPNQLFEIQADGTLTADSIGLNAVFIYTNSGSTYTGKSGVELDTTSDVPAADASNQMLIMGLSPRADNDLASANSVAIVKLINHTYAQGTLGVGIA